MPAPPTGPGPNTDRVVLSRAEFAVLTDAGPFQPPPGFEPAAIDDVQRERATRSLVDRALATPVHLRVLAAPLFTVRFEVAVSGYGSRSYFAVAGDLGASLFALPGGRVELSGFAAAALGHELVRAVPGPDELLRVAPDIRKAFAGNTTRPPAGRLPLVALHHLSTIDEVRDRTSLAERLRSGTVGTLWCLVSGAGPAGVLAGQVVWLATDDGWLGLRPDPDGSPARMVTVIPVVREDIGAWLAPYLAQILEAHDVE